MNASKPSLTRSRYPDRADCWRIRLLRVTSVILCNTGLPVDFRYAPFAIEVARRCKYVAMGQQEQTRCGGELPLNFVCGNLQGSFARHNHPDPCSLSRLSIQIDPTT